RRSGRGGLRRVHRRSAQLVGVGGAAGEAGPPPSPAHSAGGVPPFSRVSNPQNEDADTFHWPFTSTAYPVWSGSTGLPSIRIVYVTAARPGPTRSIVDTCTEVDSASPDEAWALIVSANRSGSSITPSLVSASDFPEKKVSYAEVIVFFCSAVSPLASAAPGPPSPSVDCPPVPVAEAEGEVVSPPPPESPEPPHPATASATAAHNASAAPAERAGLVLLRVRILIMVRLPGGTTVCGPACLRLPGFPTMRRVSVSTGPSVGPGPVLRRCGPVLRRRCGEPR